jgi:hypothetical protein
MAKAAMGGADGNPARSPGAGHSWEWAFLWFTSAKKSKNALKNAFIKGRN